MGETLTILNFCPSCGAPIYGLQQSEIPQVVRTCSPKCPMAVGARKPPAND